MDFVTIYFSPISLFPYPGCYLITSPPCHLATLSPCYPTTSPPCHLITLSSESLPHIPSSPHHYAYLCHCPHLTSSSLHLCPCLHLCPHAHLSIPFPRHCTCAPWISIISRSLSWSPHLTCIFFSSPPLFLIHCFPFVLISTCSFFLDHMLSSVSFPTMDTHLQVLQCSLIFPCLHFSFCTYTAWSVLNSPLVLISLHM